MNVGSAPDYFEASTGAVCPAPDAPSVGVIEEVHGPVIDILCARLPPLHRALYVCLNDERYLFEVFRLVQLHAGVHEFHDEHRLTHPGTPNRPVLRR